MQTEVPDSPNKICISNIPTYINEEAIIMLLKSFGDLKSFVLVKDAATEESRVSFEYLPTVQCFATNLSRELPFMNTSTRTTLLWPLKV